MQISKRDIQEIVRLARSQPPTCEDASMSRLREAKIASPILVLDARDEPSFWFVPLTIGEKACGFATLDLQGGLQQLGIFGASAHDEAAWPSAAYFSAPPEEALKEIAAAYPGATLSRAVFSFDGIPTRWDWRLRVSQKNGNNVVVFISLGGWYPARGEPQAGREG